MSAYKNITFNYQKKDPPLNATNFISAHRLVNYLVFALMFAAAIWWISNIQI